MSEQIAKQIAEKLDGSEYPLSISDEIRGEAKETHIVIVTHNLGYCDIAGFDETVVYTGERDAFYLSETGIYAEICYSVADLPRFERRLRDKIKQKELAEIKLIKESTILNEYWAKSVFMTDLPSSPFNIMKDGVLYCIGRVIYLHNMRERLS